MRLVLAVALIAWPVLAPADLYRWVDPESGSIKFSSYPPPWYGDAAKQRRAPKVEHIPAGREAPGAADREAAPARGEAEAAPAAARPRATEPVQEARAIEEQRRELLTAFASLRQPEDFARARAALPPQIELFRKLSADLDRLDPNGAARRLDEARPVLERLSEALRQQLGAVPPRER